MPENVIRDRFRTICKKLGIEADEDALALLAENADGSVRDGLSLLDLCAGAGGKLTRQDVQSLLGIAGTEVFIRITGQIAAKDTAGALTTFAEVLSEGKEPLQFAKDLMEHLRSLMIIKFTERPEEIINLSPENVERLRSQADALSMDLISRSIRAVSDALADARWSSRPRILIELALIEMCR